MSAKTYIFKLYARSQDRRCRKSVFNREGSIEGQRRASALPLWMAFKQTSTALITRLFVPLDPWTRHVEIDHPVTPGARRKNGRSLGLSGGRFLIGFTIDKLHRMRPFDPHAKYNRDYPLIERQISARRLHRARNQDGMADAAAVVVLDVPFPHGGRMAPEGGKTRRVTLIWRFSSKRKHERLIPSAICIARRAAGSRGCQRVASRPAAGSMRLGNVTT